MHPALWIVPVLVSALVPTLAPPAAIPDAATLRERVLAARGPDPVNAAQTVTITAGGNAVAEHVYVLGSDVRITRDAGIIHEERGRFGNEQWHQNANGLTVFDGSSDAPVGIPGVPEPPGAGTVRAAGGSYVVSDVDANGLGVRETIDAATYRILKMEQIGRGGTRTTEYADFAPCGSQVLPAAWTVTESGDSTRARRSACAPGTVAAAEVAEPGVRRVLADVPGGVPTQIPAKFVSVDFVREPFVKQMAGAEPYTADQPVKINSTTIIVPVSIRGHTYAFLLDSGSNSIILDTSVARALGMKLYDPRTVYGARPHVAYQSVAPPMTIGTVRMHDVVVGVEPLRDQNGDFTSKNHVDGLLGFDFFATLGVSIDYVKKRVVVTPATMYRPPDDPQAVTIDARLASQVPEITVALDGVEAHRFVVDTGNGFGSYVVFDHFMDQHPSVGERSSRRIPGNGLGGSFNAQPFFVRSFRLGDWEFRNFSGYSIGAGSYPGPSDGLVGPTFLDLFTADFDYAHGRIYLTPTIDTQRLLHHADSPLG